MSQIIFHSAHGSLDKTAIQETIKECGATECDALYVHTDMTLGLPALGRKQLLGEILDVFESLDIDTVIFPTFTFSFCNNEDYDIQRSRTPMGAINEYIRKSGHGMRTADPLLSVCVLGKPLNLLDSPGEYSIGLDSTYDRLRNSGKEIKFLFFGAKMWECFTYTHYVEAMFNVPYRYNRLFTGNIVDNGESRKARAWLFSTYANCRLSPRPVVYENMKERGMLNEKPLGDGVLCCLREKDAWASISGLLEKDVYCLTDGHFDEAAKDASYNQAGIRIVSVT